MVSSLELYYFKNSHSNLISFMKRTETSTNSLVWILFRCRISQIIQHHFKNTDSNWTLSAFQPDCPGYDVRTVPMVFWLASMAEWSKAEHLSCSLFGDAGSNPARCTLLGYSFFTGTLFIFKNVYSNYHFYWKRYGEPLKISIRHSDKHRWRSGLTRPTQDRFPSGAQVRTLLGVNFMAP